MPLHLLLMFSFVFLSISIPFFLILRFLVCVRVVCKKSPVCKKIKELWIKLARKRDGLFGANCRTGSLGWGLLARVLNESLHINDLPISSDFKTNAGRVI